METPAAPGEETANWPRRAAVYVDLPTVLHLLGFPGDLRPVAVEASQNPPSIAVMVEGPTLEPLNPTFEAPYMSLPVRKVNGIPVTTVYPAGDAVRAIDPDEVRSRVLASDQDLSGDMFAKMLSIVAELLEEAG